MFYFVRRVPVDVLPYYSSNRISISLNLLDCSRFLMPSAVLFEISADANFDEICVKSKDKFPDLDEEANSTLKDTSLHCV